MALYRATTSTQSSSTSFTVAKPPGTVKGDILVAFQTGSAFGSAQMTTPTGGAAWQLLGQRSDTEWAGTKVWWKVAGTSEPASYGFQQTATRQSIAAVVCVTDAPAVAPLIGSTQNTDSDATVSCPALSASTAPGVTIRWAAGLQSGSTSWSQPAGHTERVDRNMGEATAALDTATRTLTGSTGAATLTASTLPIFSHGFTVDIGGTSIPPPEPEPAIPPSKDIHYRYVAADLLTDDFIATLDLADVSYDRRIGEPGSFSATIPIPSATVADKVATIIPRYPDDLSTGPGRVVIHIYRNGIVWGSYLIWSAGIGIDDRGRLSARISGATLESYLDHVAIRDDLSFDDEDQVEIGRALIDSMQEQTHADIGLTVEGDPSGVPRTVAYLADEGSTYGDRLKELSELDDGFEWIIQTRDTGSGVRVRELQIAYPRLGSTETEHVIAQPGNVVAFAEDIDATRGGTSVVVTGESASTDLSESTGPTLSAPHDATAHFAAGWPRLDVSVQAHFERDTDTLDDYAARWIATNAGAVRVHQVTIRLDGDDLTPASLGDTARVVLVNNWWPRVDGGASFNRSWRIIGISVQATTRGQRETAQITFEEVAG